MANLEGNVISNNIKQIIYCRYDDDIFVVIKDKAELLTLKKTLEKSSVLKFTYKLGVDQKIPFLDVDVENNPWWCVCNINL